MNTKIKQSGQAYAEYMVGLILLVTAFFIPLDGNNGANAVELLSAAFQNNYKGYEYVMSQPSAE